MTREPNPLSPNDLVSLQQLVKNQGLRRVAASLAVSSATLLRVLAQQPVRRGTLALLRQGLAQMAKSSEVPQ